MDNYGNKSIKGGRMFKKLLIASLVFNVLLIALLVVQKGRHQTSSAPAAATVPDARDHSAVENGGDDNADVERRLRDLRVRVAVAGDRGDEAKRIIAATLLRSASETAPSAYWRPRVLRDGRARLDQFETMDALRKALISVYGESAAEDEAFSSVFAPRRQQWSFMPRATQRAVETVLANDLRDRIQRNAVAESPVERDELDKKLRTVMTEQQFHEFQLRESRLADQLTATEFQFTEVEYRNVFDIWSRAIAEAPPQRRQFISPLRAGVSDDPTMQKIQAALGTERFALYARAQDPIYKLLKATDTLYALKAGTADRAYAVIEEAKAKASPMLAKGPIVSPDIRRKLGLLQIERSKRLREILGESVAQLVERSMAPFDAFDMGMGRVPVVMGR
jgi:hypothetical protein